MHKSVIKKPLSLLLSLLMALSVLGSLPVTSASAYSVGDLIEFGSYPQTKVTDSSLISSLNAVQKYWASYKYYRGTSNSPGSMQPFDGVLFADLWFEGVKYRALKIDQYRPTHTFYTSSSGNSEQDDRGYYTGTVYYFKYEPLIWRVLDPTDGFVICENLVDAQPLQSVIYSSGGNYYQDAGSTVYANNYATSTLRDWLNYEFYETAFTDTQKANILVHSYGNEFPSSAYNYPATDDKISLATAADVTNADYGFSENSSRSAVATDYAKSQGMYKNNQWRLRSPGTDSKSSNFLNNSGGFTEDSDVYYVGSGIRPVCYLSDLQEDTAVSENLFSAVQYNKQGYAVGDLIEFGSYPQTKVTDADLIAALDSQEKSWASYRYYASNQPGNWMRFADFFYNGEKYRAVAIDANRPNRIYLAAGPNDSIQDENGYTEGNTYYFKYEPITWRVLDPATALVMSEYAIDAQSYQDVADMTAYGVDPAPYLNNYEYSTLRAFLISDFYDIAFTESQKANIRTTTLNNDAWSEANADANANSTNDKIFALSYAEVQNTAYGFTSNASRVTTGTDYARSQVLESGNPRWLLRTAGRLVHSCCLVNPEGTLSNSGIVNYSNRGVRPACHLTVLVENTAVSETLYSVQKHTAQGCFPSSVNWSWASDHTSATATFGSCEICGAALESQTDNAPVYEGGTFTATVTLTGNTYTDQISIHTGDTLLYGTYPQTQVTDETLIAALDAQEKTWASYRYYSGTSMDEYARSFNGQMKPGDWMRFADFTYNGEKYRAVVFEEYRPGRTGHSFARNDSTVMRNGFSKNTVYYFKYEPLAWRVLDPATGLVMCENMIDAQPYQNMIYNYNAAYYGSTYGNFYQGVDSDVYCSDYVTSHVRAFLNDDFYNTAFSADQKANIKTTVLDNSAAVSTYNSASTADKVFLISYSEAQNSAYGFTSNASRCLYPTDYALSQGCISPGYSWWLRTPGSQSYLACSVRDNGAVNNNGTVCDTFYGVCPACCLTDLAEDVTLSENLYSEEKRAAQVCSVTLAPGEAAGESITQEVFKDYTLPAVPASFIAPEGKMLSGWLSDADGIVYAPGTALTLTGDVTFTAQWVYPVHASFEPGEAEGETITNGDVLPGTVFALPANPYTAPGDTIFSGWSDGENVYQPGDSYTLNETTTFTAQWTDAVYAWLAPGEAEGETITHARVLPGTRVYLPANPYSAPAGMLFNGWSDTENVYQPGNGFTLSENVTFTAQWVTGVNVTFDSNGGSAVASQLIYPNTAPTRPSVPTKAGCIFKGWRLDGAYYDFSTPLTEDVTLCAVWVEGIEISESFASGTVPSGWTAESYWQITRNQYNGSNTVYPHSGEYMAYHPFYNSSRLTMPAVDLSGQSSVSLNFWYQNCYDGNNYPDNLIVSCRVNGGEWVELFRTTQEHKTWTQATVALPAGALRADVEISFYAEVNGGWGIFIDDVSIVGNSGHNLFFSAEESVLTATCSNDPCAWETNTLTLTLNAPEKTVYGDENSEFATLTDLGRFNVELGLAVSEDDIEYYEGETLLDAAPTGAGDYTASLTVNIDGTDYTITNAYTIAKATPEYTVPTDLTATYGDLLSSVELPDGWAWNDAPDTLVGNAGENTFDATFTPADTANYNTASETLTVAVGKAAPEYEIPTGLTVLYGSTLADAALPEGWTWNDAAETPVGCLGDHTFSATFTPADPENYITVTETLSLHVYTNYTFVPAKAPACTVAGNTEYYANAGRYYVVTEDNELEEVELYITVIPATGHIYGTEGDARSTCTVCGHVDLQRKEDAEYEDMLPYYLAEFNACKEEVKRACDSRALPDDSEDCRNLIEEAKRKIDALPFERSKMLDGNKAEVYAVLDQLNRDLASQRGFEKVDACPLCGGYHNGSLIGILHAMIYVIKNFFETLFQMN